MTDKLESFFHQADSWFADPRNIDTARDYWMKRARDLADKYPGHKVSITIGSGSQDDFRPYFMCGHVPHEPTAHRLDAFLIGAS